MEHSAQFSRSLVHGQSHFERLARLSARNDAEFPVVAKGKTFEGEIDYEDLKDESKAGRFALDHGFDDKKPDSQITIEDLKVAAKFRAGEVVSENFTTGDVHSKITWKCHNGHSFDSTPFTILRGGFWCPICSEALPWAFDKVAAKIPFYAQVWYDTHKKSEENNSYPYDEHEDDDMIVSVEKL